jgi:hypothetical protein
MSKRKDETTDMDTSEDVIGESTAPEGEKESTKYAYTIVDGRIVDPIPPLQKTHKLGSMEVEDVSLKDNRTLSELVEFYGEESVLRGFLASRRITLRKYLVTAITKGSDVDKSVHSSDALKSTRQPAGVKLGRVEFMTALADGLNISVNEFTPEQLATIDAKFSK